ncbi:hypothetical protein II906_05925 [bacterium]|nr:hypothetical protein [bacterium]
MDGKKYYEIANILHISKKSVSANIKSVISKLKAKNAIHSAVILTKILKNLNPL